MPICLLLCSCSFQPDISDITTEYAQRLATVMDSSAAELSHITPLPELPTENISADIVEISLKDFYQLRNCRLYSLVAERNTALGKIQAASQRYLYEIKLLQEMQVCLNLIDDKTLREQIQQWQQQKQSALQQQWQLVLQSDEIRYALSRNNGWIGTRQTDQLGETRQSLQYLLNLRPETHEQRAPSALEKHLQQLQQARLMARVFRTARLLDSHLSSLTQWLKARQIHCPDGNAPQQIQYLRNVFGLFFIEQIQPLASRLNDIYYQLMPKWQSLLQAHKGMDEWLHQRESEFEQYRHSLTGHIKFWQTLFKQCNLSPPVSNKP
ncbi:DUF3080 family protein [Lacimicrobium alkaliphilum]|nr:DUF3080 family protein [Lacimicrobium alkaliphilum]